MTSRRTSAAFTIMELLVVVVVLGIISGFAIPNYIKSVDKALAREVRNNLIVLHSAQQDYYRNNAAYYTASGTAYTTQLNSTLLLSIIEQNGTSYNCVGAVCYGSRTVGGSTSWAYAVGLAGSTPVLTCYFGTCPI